MFPLTDCFFILYSLSVSISEVQQKNRHFCLGLQKKKKNHISLIVTTDLNEDNAASLLDSLGFRQKTEELSLQMSVQIFVYCDLSCQYITNGFTYVYLSTSYRHSVDTTTHSYYLLNSCLTRGVPVAITTEKDGTSLTQRATVTVTSSKYPSGPVCQPWWVNCRFPYLRLHSLSRSLWIAAFISFLFSFSFFEEKEERTKMNSKRTLKVQISIYKKKLLNKT